METSDKNDWTLLMAMLRESLQSGSDLDESRLPGLIDRFRKGGLRPSEIGSREAAALMGLLPVLKKMEGSGERFPLPEALEAAVERYFRAEKASRSRRSEADSIVIRIKEGLELVSAALQGLQPAFVTIPATRRSATAQKINMSEEATGGGVIEYDILRSTDNTVIVSVTFKDLQGPLSVRLSENGRPVSSQTIRETSGRIHFDGLCPGEYRLDLSGSCERSFTLQLLAGNEN